MNFRRLNACTSALSRLARTFSLSEAGVFFHELPGCNREIPATRPESTLPPRIHWSPGRRIVERFQRRQGVLAGRNQRRADGMPGYVYTRVDETNWYLKGRLELNQRESYYFGKTSP